MADDPLTARGDRDEGASVRRRPDEEIRQELAVDRSHEQAPHGAPGGAEGGEDSRAADAIVDMPGEPGPLGDTDQHSDPANLPENRRQRQRD
jgi:hypothetical protein